MVVKSFKILMDSSFLKKKLSFQISLIVHSTNVTLVHTRQHSFYLRCKLCAMFMSTPLGTDERTNGGMPSVITIKAGQLATLSLQNKYQ